MSGITLHDASIGNLLHGTIALRNILQKASEQADSSAFPSAKLIDDMYPLTFQLKIATNMAEKAVKHLVAGSDVVMSDIKEGSTLADLIARCDKTVELLKGVDAKAVNGKEDEVLSVQLGPNSKPVEITGKEFVFGHVLPNFFFHVNATYAILRMKGVPIGKMDYLNPFMTFAPKV
ncbi:hypothetical protein GE09DRAFT_1215101 [Coniochaeta sp. 2T2.1]|nr:hypothetical protein GE09DRAFT_1215101 [Coniochaeta sp. 2T2.1]